MTDIDMFDLLSLELQIKLKAQVKKLKARIKDLIEINKSHQAMNGRIRRELNTERKNHDITREDNQALNMKIDKLEKKLSKNV